MSGDVAPAAGTPSTADIAAHVIETAEAPAAESTPSEPTPSPTPTPTPAVVEPELSPAAKFLLKQGHQAKKVDGRPVWLPYQTVEKMLESYMGEHRTQWDGEKKTLSEQVAAAKEWHDAIAEQKALISGDPRQYLSTLASIDPRYAAFLDQKAAEPAAPLKLPEFDAEWNGARTWSADAFEKTVIPFIIQQAEAKAEAKAQAALKPITEREEQFKATTAIRERTQSLIAEAKGWPGFTDHEGDILKALQADSDAAKAAGKRPTLTLEAAYRQVVIPKLAGDRNKMREELLKEMSDAAKAGPTVAKGAGEVPKPGQATTADIARRTIERLERGA